MLKSKQVGQISQYARYFFVSGSRNTPADGNLCSGSEDEIYVPRKQQTSNKILFPNKCSTIGSDTPAREGFLPYGDRVGTIGHYKAECGVRQASVAHALSTSNSRRSGREKVFHQNGIAKEKDVNSFVVGAQKSVKGRVAGATSNLENHNSPISERNRTNLTSHNRVADSMPSSNIESSAQKLNKRENFNSHAKPFVHMGGSISTYGLNDKKGKVEKYEPVHYVSTKFAESSGGVAGYDVHSDTKEQEQTLPPGLKSNPHHFLSKPGRAGPENEVDGDFVEAIKSADSIQKPQEYVKTSTKTAAGKSASGRHLIEHVYLILQQEKWGTAVEAALNGLQCSLSVYHGNQILKRLQDYSVAHEFFYWLKRQPGFKHDEHSYTTMVGILGRARQFNIINRLLDEMVSDGCLPNVVTYNRLIHSYGRANCLDEAVDVFYQMQEAGCAPDRVTYCTLIDIHAKAGFLDVALDMYKRMQEVGLVPDTFTYSVMINCLGKAGHLESSYKLFRDMIAQGCVPNLVTYNIMIALQAKARNYPRALQLYRDMQVAGFEPDRVTYSIVMEVLGHCGKLEEAEALFMEMKQKNWVPDEPVYGLLVDLWGKVGDVDKARGWYQEMLDAGVCPNIPTCNSLVSAFLRVNQFSDAYSVLQSIPTWGLKPSLQTYTLLLSFCTDTEYFSDTALCCELMAITGHPAHAFLQSMPAADPDGQNVREHANSFLELMRSEDLESKRGLVDAVVDFLHKSGLKEEASSVWEVAAQKNVYPDAVREKSSCYWLINLHVMSDGTAITALSRTLAWFHRQMVMSGIGPMRIDIVTGWGRRSRVTGSSLVRQSVKELLHFFEFPLSTESGNTGCFVGRGDPLHKWLLHPYVERMHLL